MYQSTYEKINKFLEKLPSGVYIREIVANFPLPEKDCTIVHLGCKDSLTDCFYALIVVEETLKGSSIKIIDL